MLPATVALPVIGDSGPLPAYREYLSSIAQRDCDAVLEAMTEDYGRQLRALRHTLDFGPLFELWCQSQGDVPAISRCQVEGDRATVEARGRTVWCRADLRWIDGRWRVDAERHEIVKEAPGKSACAA
jgi:hypothetical protein